MNKMIIWCMPALLLCLQYCQPGTKVLPSPNGIEYMPEYKTWQVVNVEHRTDNKTIRVIYGNPIAVKAIHSKHTKPWPEGTILAKAVFDAIVDSTGMYTPGAFQQVMFMVKDSQRYSQTLGWGWARWKGADLSPYGKNATFTNECTGCHRPQKDKDYVFTDPKLIY
ncbi:cytochrome P460 family protein [Chitinophaga silvisoli]|uniref:Cytochrome P460 n=1 Tax=Chitinophaga silvisoli TaxID=2291814 RepID=A0A3E1NYB7_9BACT|nr:cytochrome P460 family protein [Chitinophaga silvisoli]RFM32919.1 cytochrome P460 [Chitinophaga silvisoli]